MSSSDWPTYSIGEIAEIHNAKRVPLNSRERENRRGKYPYYGASGIVDYIDDYIFDGDFVLISEDGENLRSRTTPIAFRASGKFWVNNHAHIVRGKKDFVNDWLVYCFQNLDLNPYITGAVQPKLNRQNLELIEIPMPDDPRARKITSILSALDEKIELNRQTNATLEAIAQAIFKEWFVHYNYPGATGEFVESELGLIPAGWRVGKLEEIITNYDRKRIPLSSRERQERKGPYPYYGAASIVDYIDDYLFDGVYLLLGEDGTVITNDEKPILQYVSGKFWVNNHAHVLQGKEVFSTEFAYLLLKNTNIKHIVTGAVQPKINQRNMNSLPAIIPDHATLNVFQATVKSIFEFVLEAEQQSKCLAQIRDTLLPKLMRGEVEV